MKGTSNYPFPFSNFFLKKIYIFFKFYLFIFFIAYVQTKPTPLF
jgi:hypothetical protein